MHLEVAMLARVCFHRSSLLNSIASMVKIKRGMPRFEKKNSIKIRIISMTFLVLREGQSTASAPDPVEELASRPVLVELFSS
jgi:hypothetical protein